MVISIKRTNKINHVLFVLHAFSQNEHPFDQFGHFNEVEPFEKPWFLVMLIILCIMIS